MRKEHTVWEINNLKKILSESYSISDAARNISKTTGLSSGIKQKLRRKIKEYNLDISHFPPIHIRISIGTKKFKPKLSDSMIFVNKKQSRKNVRDRFFIKNPPKNCDICKINKWNDKVISFQIDHIDGNCNNNQFNNLRWLCPNCHSQTDTYSRGLKKKINFPEDEVLIEMYKTISQTEIAKQINTSSCYVGTKINEILGLRKEKNEETIINC